MSDESADICYCPVYNSGQYLARCIESVLHQSFVDFELLLINDGILMTVVLFVVTMQLETIG